MPRTLDAMDTNENTRVSTREAAAMAGVSERTIKRWAAAGRIGVRYERTGNRSVGATYDPGEVRAQERRRAPRKAPHSGS